MQPKASKMPTDKKSTSMEKKSAKKAARKAAALAELAKRRKMIKEAQAKAKKEAGKRKRTEAKPFVLSKLPSSPKQYIVPKTSTRFRYCAEQVVRMMAKSRGGDEVRVEDLISGLNSGGGGAGGGGAYSRAEVEAILRGLEEDNRVMFRQGLIHQI